MATDGMTTPQPEGQSDTPEDLEKIVGMYLDRLNSGETLDPIQVLAENPLLGREVLERLQRYVDLVPGQSGKDPLGTLGDYTLRRQIGRGGMGVVYDAWQNSVDRQVALKVLPAGIAADAKIATRFIREAQIAGKLSHPQIVAVYGSGVEAQTPYYSMEYVEGETLLQVLTKIKEADAEAEIIFGRKDCAGYFENIAATFADVADGLQHAHSKGVVHRDIKPSNLILDSEGRLRILDFGLARLEGQESLTISGDLVGTPLYMSPEQARQRKVKIDHRTDVYSLGATMYEMLTSRPPFKGKDHRDTLSQIIERDPVEPRKLNARLPKDLETIVLKCLRKDADDRYATAEALAQDLRRLARGDPIEARPQSGWEKLARTLSRRRKLVTATAISVLIALAGLVTSNALIWREKEYTRLALERAERNFQKARDAVERMLFAVGAEDLANVPLMEKVRQTLLEDALEFYEGFLEERSTDVAVRYEAGRAYGSVGKIHEMIGQYIEGERAYKKSLEILEDLAREFLAEPRYRQLLGSTCNDFGGLLGRMYRIEEAKSLHERALKLQKELVAAFPHAPEYRYALSGTYHNLGRLCHETGKGDEGRKLFQFALDQRRGLVDRLGDVPEYSRGLVETYNSLAGLLDTIGSHREAEALYRKALGFIENLPGRVQNTPGDTRRLANTHCNLGVLLRKMGRDQEAEELIQATLPSRRKLATDFPYIPRYQHELATTYLILGALAANGGRHAEAEERYFEALALWKRLSEYASAEPEFRLSQAIARDHLAAALKKTRREWEAFRSTREAVTLKETLTVEFPQVHRYRVELARSRNELAALLALAGQYDTARSNWDREAHSLVELTNAFPGLPEASQVLAGTYDNLSTLLWTRLGNLDDAREYSLKALTIRQQLVQQYPEVNGHRYDLAVSYQNLGRLIALTGPWREAQERYEGAIKRYGKLAAEFPDNSGYRYGLATSQTFLVDTLLRTSGPTEPAEGILEEALGTLEDLVEAHPDAEDHYFALSFAQNTMVKFLVKERRLDEASAACEGVWEKLGWLTARFPIEPMQVQEADLDGDGDLDLATSNWGYNNVSLLRNDGNGVFSVLRDIPVGSAPYGLTAVDLDADGDVDLAAANSGHVSVLLNGGDGTFALPTDIALPMNAGERAFGLTAADLDNDGDVDLAAVGGSDKLWVLLNDGSAAFHVRSQAVGPQPYEVAASDLDGDGNTDLAIVSSSESDSVSILWNDGNAGFAPLLPFSVGGQAYHVTAADLDGDGDLDLAVGSASVWLLRNKGNREFELPSPLFHKLVDSVIAADLNGDGNVDLALAGGQEEINVWVLLNDGDGSFEREMSLAAGDEPTSATAADLNGDKKLDLAVLNTKSGNVSVFFADNVKTDDPNLFFKPVEHFAVGLRPLHRHLRAKALCNQGDLLRAQMKPGEAAKAYRESLVILRELAANFPSDPAYKQEAASLLNQLAEILLDRGEPVEARRSLERAIEYQRSALRLNPRSQHYRKLLEAYHSSIVKLRSERASEQGSEPE